MSNSNNSESRARFPKNPRTLYEFSTLDDGNVVIKAVIVPREELPVVDGKVKNETVLNTRVTD